MRRSWAASPRQNAANCASLLAARSKLLVEPTPCCGCWGRRFTWGGLGAGSAAKLVANSALLGVLTVLGESLALGETLGLTRPTAFDVLAATPLAEQAQRRRGALDTGTFPARFRLSLARKDADLMLAEAAAAGRELRMMRSVRSWLEEAERRDRGEMDYTAVLATILDASAGGNPSAG